MAVQHAQISASSGPQAVAGSRVDPTSYHGYIRVRLKSIAGTCYLGDSGVSTGSGWPLTSADAAIQETIAPSETLWVASSSGATATLAILRLGETT